MTRSAKPREEQVRRRAGAMVWKPTRGSFVQRVEYEHQGVVVMQITDAWCMLFKSPISSQRKALWGYLDGAGQHGDSLWAGLGVQCDGSEASTFVGVSGNDGARRVGQVYF